MLSLPEDWNYNIRGLASLSQDGIDSVRSAIKELNTTGMWAKYNQMNRILHQDIKSISYRINDCKTNFHPYFTV